MSDVEHLIEQAKNAAREPLVAEAQRLREIISEKELALENELCALRHDLANLEHATAALDGQSRTLTPSSHRAAPGENRDKILSALQAAPRSTAAEIASTTEIAKTTVHATLHKLATDGLTSKEREHGRGVVHWLRD